MLDKQNLEFYSFVVSSTSAVISLFSVSIAFMAYRRSSSLSEKMNELTERATQVNELSKFSDVLDAAEKDLSPFIDQLSSKAYKFLKDIWDYADTLDLRSQEDRCNQYMRHTFYTIIGLLYNSFSYELTGKNYLRLYQRFKTIVDIEDDLAKFTPRYNKVNFSKEYSAWQNNHLERQLYHSKEFINIASEYLNGISEKDKLYRFSQEKINIIFHDLRNNELLIKKWIKIMEDLKKKNDKYELIKLSDAYQLNDTFDKFLNKLIIVEHLYLLEMDVTVEQTDCQLSRVILIGFILMLIYYFNSWGEWYEF